MTDDRDRRIAQAFEAHRARVDDVLPTGDRAAIKQLYVEFGALLEAAAGTDVDSVPLLSFPEIGPVVAALLDDRRGLVLDAGCGPSPALSLLLAASPDRTVVSMDISHGSVMLAKERAKQAGARLLPVVGDLEALPFADGVFGGAACEDTIEHVPDDERGVTELARVMRPDGRLVLTTPNRTRIGVRLLRLKDRLSRRPKSDEAYYAATSHLREYTWGDLETLVRRSFDLVRRGSVPWSGGASARFGSALVRFAPFRSLGRVVVLDLRPRLTHRGAQGSTEA
ncbi:MAG: class I SAM-dependent methyltransferase [Actinomycetota bacterium]